MRNTSLDLAAWVTGWKEAEADLREFGRKELRSTDTYRSMLALSDAFEAAVSSRHDELPITGLVEQQRYFGLMKLR